jgi:catechol 2,3-dioxygenase-like lactoylglutathione lyase family enzyme
VPIDHLGLGVPDVEAAKVYYDEFMPLVGFVREWESGYRATDWYGAQIFLYSTLEDGEYSRHRIGLQHISFYVPTRADVHRVHEWAKERGHEIVHEPNPSRSTTNASTRRSSWTCTDSCSRPSRTRRSTRPGRERPATLAGSCRRSYDFDEGAAQRPTSVLLPAGASSRQRGKDSRASTWTVSGPPGELLGATWVGLGRRSVMPKDKNFKRLVRGRMEKTGERFAAARAQLQAQRARLPESESVAREKAVEALRRQVEHLRDAADQARAAGLSLGEISRVVRLDRELLRRWLLAESLEEGGATQ